ncbi:MAG TPA: DUF3209 family protein, partial [Longimicrobiales bacterium]|nr:DUF3209 family protein [Longimicrobiales bacterium]
MACHELAALRLALMNVLGIDDPAEKQHELAELGNAAEAPGPLRSLAQAQDLASLQRFFAASLVELQERVSATKADDPKMPYFRSLLILTKSVELELQRQSESLNRLWRDLEEMHDFTHEVYPRD